MDRTDLIRPQSLELDNHSNTNFCMDREPPVSEIAIDGPGPFRLNSTLAGYEKVYSSQASSRPQNHPSPNSAHETSLFGSIHHELRRGSVYYQTEGPTKLQPNQLGITEMSTSENSFECFEINNNSFSELMDIMEIPCGSEMDEVVYGNRLKDALPGSSTPNSCSFQSSDWYQENEFPGYPHDIPYLDMPERTGTEEEDVPPCCNCGLRDASNTPYDPTGDWFCETCRPCSGEIAMDGLSAKLFQCLWPGCDKSFSSKTRLRHHRTHTKPFHCVTCRKSFGRPTLLEKHKRTHTNEKPFPCTICEMSFRQKGHLTRHNQSQVHSIRKKLKEHEQIKRNENESLRLLIGSIQQYLASLAHPILLQQGNGSQSNEKASKVGSFNAASCEGSRYQEAQTPAKQSGQNSIPCDLLVPYLDRIKQLADRMTIAEVAVTKKTDTIPTDRRVDMARQAAHRALVQYLRCLQGQE